jgi:hypothetical protein
MNVLILTPDRVGSTLLQRLITVYMNMHEFDQPVINLHELTNGLIKYYSTDFDQEVLGKPNGRAWGYFQTLEEITDLLHSVPHYKTSRLAHYHIKNRQDTMAEQVPFYQYLNDNFFIISAQRDNLLEHGLSWCIQTHSKRLNVYTHQEKVNTFYDLYQNRITVDPETLIKYLDQYWEYLAWVDNHFHVSSYFHYERHLPQIEKYILNLPIFNGQQPRSFKDTFDIEFQDWNLCHYLGSDLSGLSAQLEHRGNPQLEYSSITLGPTALAPIKQNEIASSLSLADQEFLLKHGARYRVVADALTELVDKKVLVTSVPIKLQTMLEKKLMIKNYDECVNVYNEWVTKNQFGTVYNDEMLGMSMQREISNWHNQARLTEQADQ